MSRIVLCIPGTPLSNNRTTRHYGGPKKNPAAVDYQARAWSISTVAAMKAKWEKPECCRVTIIHWNGLLDVDNVPKSVMDGLKGVLFADDSRKYVRGLTIALDADGGDERVDVMVESCPPIPKRAVRICGDCKKRGRCILFGDRFVCGKCSQLRRGAAAEIAHVLSGAAS